MHGGPSSLSPSDEAAFRGSPASCNRKCVFSYFGCERTGPRQPYGRAHGPATSLNPKYVAGLRGSPAIGGGASTRATDQPKSNSWYGLARMPRTSDRLGLRQPRSRTTGSDARPRAKAAAGSRRLLRLAKESDTSTDWENESMGPGLNEVRTVRPGMSSIRVWLCTHGIRRVSLARWQRLPKSVEAV